jgi:hypothetical protein
MLIKRPSKKVIGALILLGVVSSSAISLPANQGKEPVTVLISEFYTNNVAKDVMITYLNLFSGVLRKNLDDSGFENMHILLLTSNTEDRAVLIEDADKVICLLGGSLSRTRTGYSVTLLVEDVALNNHAETFSFNYRTAEELFSEILNVVATVTDPVLKSFIQPVSQSHVSTKLSSVTRDVGFHLGLSYLTNGLDNEENIYPTVGLTTHYELIDSLGRNRFILSLDLFCMPFIPDSWYTPISTVVGGEFRMSLKGMLPVGFLFARFKGTRGKSMYLGLSAGMAKIAPFSLVRTQKWMYGAEFLTAAFLWDPSTGDTVWKINFAVISFGYAF